VRDGFGGARPPFWAVGAPVLLLVIVGLVQVALAKGTALTPWKGGGFGMFSTLDHAGQRALRIVVTAPDRSEEIAITRSLADAADRATALPGRWQLTRLAEHVVARERRRQRPVSAVHIECWRTVHDTRTLRPTSRRICDVRFQADSWTPAGPTPGSERWP
jgi:hypothetical protein